jgi:2-C-methyl-D-erythritol 4-phosphate cytidylyltransferase
MNIALVLSGGTGSRLGADIPKQYIKVDGRMIIEYCLKTFFTSEYIDAVWIVANENWQEKIAEELKKADAFKSASLDSQNESGTVSGKSAKFFELGEKNIISAKLAGFSKPGENRQLSILNGLEDIRSYLAEKEDVSDERVDSSSGKNDLQHTCQDVNILIHDAARPLLTHKQISECFKALPGHDGVMPVLPMKDTVYVSNDGKKVDGLLDRSTIYAGQAPELYRLQPYYEACVALLPKEIFLINGSTEPAIRAGLDVAMIPGDEGNYKITTKADLEKFRQGRK